MAIDSSGVSSIRAQSYNDVKKNIGSWILSPDLDEQYSCKFSAYASNSNVSCITYIILIKFKLYHLCTLMQYQFLVVCDITIG